MDAATKQVRFKVTRHNGKERHTLTDDELKACFQDNVATDAHTFHVKYRFPIAEMYTIDRVSVHRLDLAAKPYIRFRSNTFVDRLSVDARVKCPGVICQFESLGTPSSFEDASDLDQVVGSGFQKKYPSLILPNQGFMVIFVKVSSPGVALPAPGLAMKGAS